MNRKVSRAIALVLVVVMVVALAASMIVPTYEVWAGGESCPPSSLPLFATAFLKGLLYNRSTLSSWTGEEWSDDGGIHRQRICAQYVDGLSALSGNSTAGGHSPAAPSISAGCAGRWRLCGGSVFAGMRFLAAAPVKLAVGVCVTLIAYGGEEHLARLTLLLFALSCALAGCVMALGVLAGSAVPMVNGIFIRMWIQRFC